MREGNRIGIILSSAKYKKLRNGDTNMRKAALLYMKAARGRNCSVCFFRLQDLKVGKTSVTCLIKERWRFKLTTVPVPKVIYKRVGHSRKHLPLFKNLKRNGTIVFKYYNNNYKWNVWKIVNNHNTLSKNQPFTKIASVRSVKTMIADYPSVIIKPNRGEAGRGIMKINKAGKGKWALYTKNKNGLWRKRYFTNQLPGILVKRIKKRKYLVQQTIDLATYKGSRFDLRVAVQRNTNNQWQVTSVFGKVAQKGQLLTNMSQGGTSYTLDHILQAHPTLQTEKVKQKVHNLALNLAKHLGHYKPGMHDLGFDIGISKDGKPFLFEANHTNDYPFFSIKNGNLLHKDWYAVYKTPIDLAASLLPGRNSAKRKLFLNRIK
ncbi:YheC/YheD family protein [Salipaludibacillus aurantiacus]|uniref:YheC/D like ATP-grasp n=1 Tax=Salipaludibacillus aurantiacus TaxID=1601833 RepID=A0A1H9UMN5_9BACI|nr:YheC/YheD family protein [Salipaludibacillus aurantiacus]SES10715.1 YheC/D like ATP-grasp [Salipaludibacillus aurantiacus]